MGMLNGKHLVVSGPVIIENGKLLSVKDNKDDFYKLPGGSIEEDIESLEQACKREVKEEINGEIEIIKPLHPQVLWKNPQTGEKMTIVLVSFLAKLKNKDKIKPNLPVKEIIWLDLKNINEWKHQVSPYTQYLIEKGDIK